MGEPDVNLEKMIGHIRTLSSGSDIICFPEASLTGYTSAGPERFSLKLSDCRIKDLEKAAVDNDVTIVFGLLEQSDTGNHITQVIIDEDGVLNTYRKTHLGRGERTSITQGEVIMPFRTPKATVGMQICWESHFPEITCKLRKGGAELILISYASPLGGQRRRDVWMKHLPARASDNGVFVGAVNSVGDNGKGSVFGGGSIVFDPKGNVLGEYFGPDEIVLTINLSSKVKDALGPDDDMGNIDYHIYRREDLY